MLNEEFEMTSQATSLQLQDSEKVSANMLFVFSYTGSGRAEPVPIDLKAGRAVNSCFDNSQY